ncbi:MAG: hypothetical protein JO149_00805, partial [Gammaproteobacteria bacterium]|nr:hypothetical protein [Gammaproteobacteria bacterium]
SIERAHSADDRLLRTLAVLTTLKPQTSPGFTWHLNRLITYYTQQSAQQSGIIYQQGLQTILIPEIRNYLGDYLKTPVNRNIEDLYAVLEAYLMLGNTAQFQAEFITNTMRRILTKSFSDVEAAQLLQHINAAFNLNWNTSSLDNNLIEQTRKYLLAMPSLKLSYAILKNMPNNTKETEVNLGINIENNPVLISQQLMNQMPAMFTAKTFTSVYMQEIPIAAEESLLGNWVLGQSGMINKNNDAINSLTNQLRATYLNNYIDLWENLLSNTHLAATSDLLQANQLITTIYSNRSPLLQFLQTLHDNTYFEPVTSMSPKLKSLGALMDKNSQTQLYQIFAVLQLLNKSIQPVLISNDGKKAAFDIVSNRMQNNASPDAITQLRLLAVTSPEPIKTWLEKIADDTWHFLEKEAVSYIDLSWKDQILDNYQMEMADAYAFNPNNEEEIEAAHFTRYFGSTGIVAHFYQTYLQAFVDTSTPEWQWKKIDNQNLPLSNIYLAQLQDAMRINPILFANENDNKQTVVDFTLNKYPVKYSLIAKEEDNSLIHFNLQQFQLPPQLSDDNNEHIKV